MNEPTELTSGMRANVHQILWMHFLTVQRGEQHVKCKTQGGHYIKEVKSQPSKADVQLCAEILEDSRSQSSRRGVTTQAGRSDVKSHVQIAGPCKSEVICTPPGLTATHRCGGKLTQGQPIPALVMHMKLGICTDTLTTKELLNNQKQQVLQQPQNLPTAKADKQKYHK